MEHVFCSLKTEWIPTTGNRAAQDAQREISHVLMHRYNWVRPHQFNCGLAPARAAENLNVVSGISRLLQLEYSSDTQGRQLRLLSHRRPASVPLSEDFLIRPHS